MRGSRATWSLKKEAQGQFAETLAMELLGERAVRTGIDSDEDIYTHIDFFYYREIDSGRVLDPISVDVKSIKCQNDRQFFVELKNSFGFNGWLYGKCDEFWFERFDSFLIHDAETLRRMIHCKLRMIDPKPTHKPAVWRFYERQINHEFGKRSDQTIIVPLDDLLIFGDVLPKTPEQIDRTIQFYDKQKQRRFNGDR